MCKWYLLINANLIKAKQMWAFTVYMKNSLRFEISISIWSIWPKWNSHRSGFHSARSHVNADNEVTSHQTEILSRSEISNRFDQVSCKRALRTQTCHSMAINRSRSPSIAWNVVMAILLLIAQMPIGELFSFSYFSVVYCVMILTILLSRDHVYSKKLDIYNKKVIDCSLYLYH